MKELNNELISVILPVYNCEPYISKSIESILSQAHANLELLILNDGSIDKTDNIIKEFSDPRIRYFSESKNIGKVMIVNKALEFVKGSYIAMQDADDWSEPNRLIKQLKFMNSSPNMVISFTGYNLIGANRHGFKVRETDAELKNEFINLAFKNPGDLFIPTHCATMMVRSDIIKKVGGYSPFFSRRICEDIHWISRILRMGNAGTVPSNLYNYTYGRKGSYTYDAHINLNPLHLYGVSLASKVIELENQTKIKLEELTHAEQLELELNACKEALVEKTLQSRKQLEIYESSTSYNIGKLITSPLQIIRKFLKK